MLVVIFRAKIKQLDDDYTQLAGELRTTALQEFGCLEFVSATEGSNEIALSYWEREDQIIRWKKHLLHQHAQERGKMHYYASYTVEVAEISRRYSFPYETFTPASVHA